MPKDSILPKNAHRVFKGIIFDVFQWKQKMYDGSYATFERLKRPNTVDVIAATKDKKILILKQRQPGKRLFTSLPGGRLDGKERPLTGIKRELKEETGYTAKAWRLLYARQPHGKIIWTMYTYVAQGAEKKWPPALDAGEKITVRKISFKDFLNLADDPTFPDPHLKLFLYKTKHNAKLRAKLYKQIFDK